MAPRKTEKESVLVVNPRKRGAPPKVAGAVRRARISPNGHKLPEQLPEGTILNDVIKTSWRLGKSVGLGGFGEIYLASDDVSKPVDADARYVIKIEPHNNGPLFAEIHFYHRVGKDSTIQEWVKDQKLDYLGMPRFVANGSHEFKGVKYRFMAMDRFGEDLQKILKRCNGVFPFKTVFNLGIRIMDILQYVHSFGYVHGDVKASNLLLGYGKGKENKVYLIDFGLACRYNSSTDGKHKEYKEDVRKAHDGTIEFTSRDAHIGAHSRRADLEILGYNMLQWLCGKLPWEDNLKDPEYVSQQKRGFMSNVPNLMKQCFPNKTPPLALTEFLQYITQLKFEEEPDYKHCKAIFRAAQKRGFGKDDMRLSFTSAVKSPIGKTVKKRAKSATSSQDEDEPNQAKGRRKEAGAVGMSKGRVKKPLVSSVKTEEDLFPSDHEVSKNDDNSFENPTPAMLLVMQRRLELQRQERNDRKKINPSKAAQRKANALKEEVVQQYMENRKSPELLSPVTVEKKSVRQPRSVTHNKGTIPRDRIMPLTARPTQSSPMNQRRNSYSPEV